MRDNQAPKTIRLRDYRPPAFLVDKVNLDVDIRPGQTRVCAELHLRRNPARTDRPADCELDGEQLTLEAVSLDGKPLPRQAFRHEEEGLVILDAPDEFVLQTTVSICPEENTALEGLYVSRGMYCTQCEAEGFRRITFYPDRPDVLSRFTTTVRADKKIYPLLLSNGNPVASGESGDRHWVTWDDPFAKPCYLFALVAGDLACLEDSFRTVSGREVALRIYAEQRDLDKLGHAMDSLKRAMQWDEEVYGREYDLDIYMIVAVSHFNMGAMENKGLNIFNTSCVLAHPQTTTDAGFERVESVVAHEYFHNWSGNRVTCRDWFQLSLKEGFTVFRDQSFSADMHSAAVKRVEDVNMLRTVQFAEDSGPMAHPVRPETYQKIDNFYTVTIYEKGAEVVRMQRNLLGAEAFRRACDLYFERFDGQAVTCDDFVTCMEEVSGLDLTRFRRWYSQAGVPVVQIEDRWEDGVYHLQVSQHTPSTPGQPEKLPLLVPFSVALLDEQGRKIALDEEGSAEKVLLVDEARQTFSFAAPTCPVPSMLRGFSAPVMLDYNYTSEQLVLLLTHDDDGYCRWDAAQRLYHAAVGEVMAGASAAEAVRSLIAPLNAVMDQAEADPAGTALLLSLPSESAIAERCRPLDPQAVFEARSAVECALGECLRERWREIASAMTDKSYAFSALAVGRRSLCGRALAYLAAARDPTIGAELMARFADADNMTSRLAALRLLAWHQIDGIEQALQQFYDHWQDDALVLDQWFAVQAAVPGEAGVKNVLALLEHPQFDWRTPNRVRAVLSTFVNGNLSAFHASGGIGYRLFADSLSRLDRINPQIAARLAGGLAVLPRLEAVRRHILTHLVTELAKQDISDNLREVVMKILADTRS